MTNELKKGARVLNTMPQSSSLVALSLILIVGGIVLLLVLLPSFRRELSGNASRFRDYFWGPQDPEEPQTDAEPVADDIPAEASVQRLAEALDFNPAAFATRYRRDGQP